MSANDVHAKTASRSKFWRFRFGLRTLFLAMSIICLIIGFELGAIREQQQAINALKGNGRIIPYEYDYEYEYERNGHKDLANADPSLSAKVFGVDAVHHVARIDIVEGGFSNGQDLHNSLSALYHLNKLRQL